MTELDRRRCPAGAGTHPPPALLMHRGDPLRPPAELLRLQSADPVSRVRTPRGIDAWLVTRHADARAVLGDPATYSSVDAPFGHLYDDWELGSRPGPGDLLRLDGDAHARLRRRLAGEFTAHRMRAFRPVVESVAHACLDASDRAGADGVVDLDARYAQPIPTLAIARLLGVPEEDHGLFQRWTASANSLHEGPEQHREGHAQVRRYFAGRVASGEATTGDDLVARLLRSGQDLPRGQQALTRDEVVVLAEGLLLAGAETTANMISLSVLALLRRPDRIALLQRRPDLVPAAVEELLRFLSIIHYGIVRRATRDTELAGHAVAAGDNVVVSLPAANHDPRAVPEPDRLLLDRQRTAHLAFGHGPHQCLGQNLARLELEVALQVLLRRTRGLRPATDRLAYKHEMSVYGVHGLPVRWDALLPRTPVPDPVPAPTRTGQEVATWRR